MPARIGFHVVANGVTYYLTNLKLGPHETRAINIRKLRDTQNTDFLKNTIPAGASDGSVEWNRIDNVAVTGRVVVIQKNQGTASAYDCCMCPCPESYQSLSVTPSSAYLTVGGSVLLTATGAYQACNHGPIDYIDDGYWATWTSGSTGIAVMNSGSYGEVDGVATGTSTITVRYSDYVYTYNGVTCNGSSTPHLGAAGVTVEPIPTNFHQVGESAESGGVLHFDYAWSSSSGNLSDLTDCTVSEKVTYPGTQSPYVWPDPPWNQATPNPSVAPNPPIPGTYGTATDDHSPGAFVKPYMAASFNASQTYNYSCTGGIHGTLMGPLTISRSVSQNAGGSWKYVVTKSGASASINPLP